MAKIARNIMWKVAKIATKFIEKWQKLQQVSLQLLWEETKVPRSCRRRRNWLAGLLNDDGGGDDDEDGDIILY